MTAREGSNGDVMYFEAGSAYAKNDFYAKGGYAGLCLDAAKSGEQVAVQMRGFIKDVPKSANSVVFTDGEKVYCTDNANAVQKSGGSRIAVGYAVGASPNTSGTVDVLLALGIA